MRFQAWRTFHIESKRIRELVEFTCLLYGQSHQKIRPLIRQVPLGQAADTEYGKLTSGRIKMLAGHTKDVYPQRLRELALIRQISSLEAYLVDAVREVSQRTLEPFNSKGPIQFQAGALLFKFNSIEEIHTDIVEQRCRTLTGKGFEEVTTFYLSSLNIDFKQLRVSYSMMQEFHARRHLLVHRLGVVDAQYAHQFPNQSVAPGDVVAVSEQYWEHASSAIFLFASEINSILYKKFPPKPSASVTQGNSHKLATGDVIAIVRLKKRDASVNGAGIVLGLNYFVDATTFQLRDLVVSASEDDRVCTIVLAADRKQLGCAVRPIAKMFGPLEFDSIETHRR